MVTKLVSKYKEEYFYIVKETLMTQVKPDICFKFNALLFPRTSKMQFNLQLTPMCVKVAEKTRATKFKLNTLRLC